MSSDKRCVLVTGAGRGLGRAIANAFHEKGFDVVATDFDEALLADLVGIAGYLTLQQDVSDTGRAKEVAALIQKNLPGRVSQPSEVAAVVYKAAVDPRRRVMYRINNDWRQRLVALLPAKIVDRVILKQLRG